MHLIAPSVLSADFLNLESDINMINESKADFLHVDVMDGVFVPNISFGQNIVKFISSKCNKIIDVHLMIVQPEKYINSFREAGAEIISIHVEATNHVHRAIGQIKETGAKAGLALNPHTPINILENVLEDIDQVVLMSVNPGFGGQKFIYNTLSKIEALNNERIKRNLKFKIEIDGGVGLQNAQKILQCGADILVAGSSVFKSDDPTTTIKKLKEIGNEIDSKF